MPWHQSPPGRQRRPDLLTKQWRHNRTQAMRRDRHRCQAPTPHGVCGAPATEVDHIERGAGHHLPNLRAICGPCHRAKTAREGTDERNRILKTGKRSPERHPFEDWIGQGEQ